MSKIQAQTPNLDEMELTETTETIETENQSTSDESEEPTRTDTKKQRDPKENLLSIDQESFSVWSLEFDFIRPFDLKNEEEKLLANHWFDIAFRELLEMDELLAIYQKVGFMSQSSMIEIQPTGKYRYMSFDQIKARFRHLKATAHFIADYGDFRTWHTMLNDFENGKVKLSDITIK